MEQPIKNVMILESTILVVKRKQGRPKKSENYVKPPKVKGILGRPRLNRTKEEKAIMARQKAIIYYKTPEGKEEQFNRMKKYRTKHADVIKVRQSNYRRRVKLEKNLKRIWRLKGMIV